MFFIEKDKKWKLKSRSGNREVFVLKVGGRVENVYVDGNDFLVWE